MIEAILFWIAKAIAELIIAIGVIGAIAAFVMFIEWRSRRKP